MPLFQLENQYMNHTEFKQKATYYNTWTEIERLAFRNWLPSMLRMGPVTVTFLKVDGDEERVIRCTLEEGVAIPHQKTTDRVKKPSDEVCPVWDLEKNQWRSFRYDSIVKIEFDFGVNDD